MGHQTVTDRLAVFWRKVYKLHIIWPHCHHYCVCHVFMLSPQSWTKSQYKDKQRH